MQPPAAALHRTLESHLSRVRLRKYSQPADTGPADAVARYVWNVRLCEALYPLLHCTEVALRNTLNVALAKRFRCNTRGSYADVPTWLDATPAVLHPSEAKQVADAKRKLRQENGRRPAKERELTPGRLVAALRFGFWTSLFDTRYDENGAAPEELWPDLAESFPGVPRALRSRRFLSKYMEDLRDLRNRAFHHEPIWLPNQKGMGLRERYDDGIKVLGWLSPDLAELVQANHRFYEIVDGGIDACREPVETVAAKLYPPAAAEGGD